MATRYARYPRKRRTNNKFLQTVWGKFLVQMSTKWLSSSVRNDVTVYDEAGEDITALLVKESGPVSFETTETFPPEITEGQPYFLFTIGTDNYTIHLNAKDGSTGDNPIALALYTRVPTFGTVIAVDKVSEFADDTGNSLTDIFVADTDYIVVGSATKFSFMTFDLSTLAGSTITPTFEIWNGSAWVSAAVTDGTAGMTTDGKISWEPAAVATWAVDGGYFKFRITRGAASVSPEPVVDTIRITQELDVGRNFTEQGLVDMIARGVSPDGMRKAATSAVDGVFG